MMAEGCTQGKKRLSDDYVGRMSPGEGCVRDGDGM